MVTNSLLWLRSDVRIDDNPALDFALAQQTKRAIFMTTPKQWRSHNMAPIKVDFILRHLQLLQQQLAHLGIELDVVEVDDFQQQVIFLQQYCQQHQINHIIANQELEVNERQRDEAVSQLPLSLTLFEADVIVPKGKVLNKQGQMFKVFTPFKKAWLSYLIDHYDQLIEPTRVPYSTPVAEEAREITFKTAFDTISSAQWPLANDYLNQVLPTFLSEKVTDYQTLRDIPSVKATSGLSPYLAIGAISAKTVVRALLRRDPEVLSHQSGGTFCWLNEIIWREFYRHLLDHFPKLAKGKSFNAKYDDLPWVGNAANLLAWQQGKTGYPIVDAAMRQLVKTGWMHNRLRMIVASFLSKHLLLDWRLGEQFFSQHLIDGDLAANNGGWQWAAGTGCDAQPYFRIFNPISQSEKFDPNGIFIRKYIPELAHVPDKYIHFPHQFLAKEQSSDCYWPAIVDHKQARLAALEFYKQA
ncbi:deoxyribodipyrimidine photo-lyase [Thalassotalea ponticola]|uniref:deoxyribodipyrimidine photo-lyase n=1 Tax=Thalassotalea ponticola TaxID=1523392 RepID=UPI0025B2E78C|nr:deoxyribodipyrimidine photo-lyase [Thalassotalea ponticola]MDN3651930.1 deoxyribodipyrimidine photo-lyase [Thalassotalea ponticola]